VLLAVHKTVGNGTSCCEQVDQLAWVLVWELVTGAQGMSGVDPRDQILAATLHW